MIPVKELLRRAEDDIVRNTVALDTMSSTQEQKQFQANKTQQLPISKHVLSTIIKHVLSESDSKNVYVRNEQDDHFLYGLVLPLLARILCASCPGLLCIVELPVSGDEPGTDDRRQQWEANFQSKAPRLLNNGFEVLTSNLPPWADGRNDFTLLTVGWVQAGVISPTTGSAVPLSFSNGLQVDAEGIAVTYANGSMCQLTVGDAGGSLSALRLPNDFPVAMFTFNYNRNGDRSKGSSSHSSEDRSKFRESTAKQAASSDNNIMVVEIGYGADAASSLPAASPVTEGPRSARKPRAVDMPAEAKPFPWMGMSAADHNPSVATAHAHPDGSYIIRHPEQPYMATAGPPYAEREYGARSGMHKVEEVHVNHQDMMNSYHGMHAYPQANHPHPAMYRPGAVPYMHYPPVPMGVATGQQPHSNMLPLFVNYDNYEVIRGQQPPVSYPNAMHARTVDRRHCPPVQTVYMGEHGHPVPPGANGMEENAGALEALVQMKYGRRHSEVTSSERMGSDQRG